MFDTPEKRKRREDRHTQATIALAMHYDRLLTALRRIASLEEKNVPKYAQQIAREAIKWADVPCASAKEKSASAPADR